MSSQGKSLFLSVALHFDAPNRAVCYIHVSRAVFFLKKEKKKFSKQLTSITEHLSDQVTNKEKKNPVLFCCLSVLCFCLSKSNPIYVCYIVQKIHTYCCTKVFCYTLHCTKQSPHTEKNYGEKQLASYFHSALDCILGIHFSIWHPFSPAPLTLNILY